MYRTFRRRSAQLPVLLLILVLLPLGSCSRQAGDKVAAMDTGPYRLSLNGVWDFRADPLNKGVEERWYAPETDRSSWDTQRIPGYWDRFRDLSAYDGYGWYVRSFNAEHREGVKYALVFDAVDDNADIWLNGKRIGSHVGYGERFYFDVTRSLRDSGNVIAVRIEDIGGPGGLIGNVTLREYDRETELLQSEYHDMQPVASADWVKDAVVYEVYLRSFSKDGTFKALQDRLPELKKLGATVIWLMPIHPIGVKNRKGPLGSPYSVKDYYAVNPAFGTLQDLRALVDAVHEEGMHIILDLVANHTAWDNPLVIEHPDWYTRNSDGTIISPNAGWHDVADLDYSNDSLRAWMKTMMLYWVRDVNVDGFRCDVAELVPYDFWVDAIAALRKVKPVMMLAEGSDPRLHIDAFDITYAWVTYDILHPIINEELPVSQIATVLTREFYRYPEGALRLRFTSNHDKNKEDGPAVLWYGPDAAKAAAVLVTLLPGVPLVYNGDEAGNDRTLSLFRKVVIDWSNDRYDFRTFYEKLLGAHLQFKALRRGGMRILPFDRMDRVFAFVRESGREAVVVIVNMSEEKAAGRIKVPETVQGQLLMRKGEVDFDVDGVRFELPPFGYAVLY